MQESHCWRSLDCVNNGSCDCKERKCKCSERAHSDGMRKSGGGDTCNARACGRGHSDSDAAYTLQRALEGARAAAGAVFWLNLIAFCYFSTGNLFSERSNAIPGRTYCVTPWLTQPFDPGGGTLPFFFIFREDKTPLPLFSDTYFPFSMHHFDHLSIPQAYNHFSDILISHLQ